MNNSFEKLPEEYENDGNTYCHGIVNCEYYHGECVFMAMGSGDPDDMPCIQKTEENLQAFREWEEERQKLFEEALKERPQGEIKKYKPLEPDYNVQCAVENLRSAYWSNEPEKVAKDFTEAEDIIISAICHHGYAVCKQSQGEWVGKTFEIDDEEGTEIKSFVCSCCGASRVSGLGNAKFCYNCGAKMQKGGAE